MDQLTPHSPGPWHIDGQFDAEVSVEVLSANNLHVCEIEPFLEDWTEEEIANAHLLAAALDLLDMARIEHELQMGGYTKATAQRLGPDAEEAFTYGGVPGLNNWRRIKREAAIAKATRAPKPKSS